MVNAIHNPDTGLPDALVRHARLAKDGELVVEVAGGLLFAIVFSVWRPAMWIPVATVGAVAAIILLFALLSGALGTWIS